MLRLLLAIALVASVFAGCVGEPPSGVRDRILSRVEEVHELYRHGDGHRDATPAQ